MPRNGSGIYGLPPGTAPVANALADASKEVAIYTDLGDEITNSLPRSGVAAMTGDLNFGNYRGINLANPTNDTDALNRQSGDARYTKKTSAFRAHRAGTDLTGIAPSTFTKIPFPTEVIDEGGKYDASTSRWTPPAGLLMIGGQAYLSGGLVDQQQINLAIYKNGSALANLDIKATYLTNPQAVCGQIVDVCDGDDYYELYIWANGAGNKTVNGNAFNTYFYGATL